MATYTTNLNLKKPEGTDYVLIGDLNGNMDNLDNTIGKLSQLNTANRTNLVEAINEANAGVTNLPYIGENGNWYEWDAANAQYIDSGVPAQGGQGAPGADGQPGKDGAAATIAIGTVTEGDAAGVTNSGTESAAILDFVLPRGRDGENGSDGVAATVQVGTVAEGDAAGVVNSGTENAAVLDFVIPRGRDGTDGQPGADGQPGQAATIQIGTVTGGDAPSVTNSGTESAAVLDFVIPRGGEGKQGEPGPNLLSGETATALNGVLRGDGANVTVAEDVISYDNLVGQTASGKLVTLNNVLPSAPLSGLTVQGWSTQAAAPSVDAPVAIDSLELSEVRVCGKNLLDPANMPATQTVTGITFTNLGYAFRLNGLATGAVALEFAAELPRDVELTFSASSSDSTALSNMTLSIEWQQGGETASLLPGETGTIPRGAAGITVKLSIPIAKRFSNAIVYLQVERGSAATAFEAYSGTTYPVSATLRAIPAAEGYSATYTDGDGTRWYADSYNLITGELTRRVLVAESYTSDTYIETEGGFISTTGELSEGATVYYRGYAEAEEAEAVSVALSSPTSSIFTNGGGWIDAATGSALGISNKTPTNITGLLKGDGAAVSAAVANTDYAAPPTAVTLTLPVSGWIADALYVQAVTVSGMRSYKHVIVNPARQVSNWRAYVNAMVRCAEQGYNTLTFAADSLPTEDLEVDVLIFG